MNYERPNNLRGVHFGPGTSLGFDIGWWVNELKQMGMGWIKIVDDSGSMFDFAKACRQAGIMPIVRMYRKWPNPGVMGTKDLAAIERYVNEGVTRWIEVNNEGNLPDEWLNHNLPQPIEQAARIAASNWIVDAERTIALGAYPAIPALAQCGHHGQCSSIRFSIAFFDWLKNNADQRMAYVLDNGGWLAVHCAVLNHAWVEDDGWHFEHPYNLGKTPFDDDNSLMGYIVPRDLISERWQRRVPVISTEGGVFHIFRQWDASYPNWVRNSYDHAVWTLEMYRWLDEWQKTHQWWYGMCEWIIAGQILGHPTNWEEESWYKVGEVRPVVQMLKDNPPRLIDAPIPPEPLPPVPILPQPPLDGFPRPLDDNGLGIHAGLELTDESIAQDVVWMTAMRIKWATVAYTNEDAMMRAARALWAVGIMPICRWVGVITKNYDFARDARMLLAEGIPAYIQIFNEPSDPREWEHGTPSDYIQKWSEWWVLKAGEVVAAGGLPGLQCLHPEELRAVFARLPANSHIWKKVWFCSHNYGLNHPPAWKEDYWCVLGFQFFEHLFREYLGFVPPIICGEGGWLYRASDDNRYPMVDDALHAQYHDEMYRWFLTGRLSDGNPLPDHLYAVCPWILSGPSDEAWFGFTDRVQTIQAVQAIPEFVRGEPMPPEPPVPPEPPGEIEFVGLSEDMIAALSISGPAEPSQPYWKVVKVEIRPQTDNQSVWVIAPSGHSPKLFWGGGEAAMPWKGPDALSPPGARDGGYSQPMFHSWGGYGALMEANSEAVFGFGLYGDLPNLDPTHTAHHPTLVYFRLVQPEAPVEPPAPPEPPVEPGIPYRFLLALDARLVAAGLAKTVDMRVQIENDYARQGEFGTGSLNEQGLWSITFHHTASTGPLNVLGVAKYHTETRGFPHIAYHFIIDKTGTVWFTKKLDHYSAHCGNSRLNKYSKAVAVHGDLTKEVATTAQLNALRCVVESLEEFVGGGWGQKRGLPILRHKDIVNTACPGGLYEAYRKHLNK